MVTNNKLIFAPSVTVIAKTAIINEALGEWADEHGLHKELGNEATPLGAMYHKLSDDELTGALEMIPEFAGRFCYRSFAKGRNTHEYLTNIMEMMHGSVLEHTTISFAISGVSRSLTHEMARHRAGVAVSQESQRYVDAKDMRFVVPPLLIDMAKGEKEGDGGLITDFRDDCELALERYIAWQKTFGRIIEEDIKAASNVGAVKLKTQAKKRINEAARSVLPNAAETRFVWTLNLRALRHALEMRGGIGADLEFRRLCYFMLMALKPHLKTINADFKVHAPQTGDFGVPSLTCSYSKV